MNENEFLIKFWSDKNDIKMTCRVECVEVKFKYVSDFF